jgi:hypothetical protein
METTVINATEYRNVSLSLLSESKTNPRRIFEDAALKELSESIRTQGILSPLLVRPLTENGFEIVAGARRYRAAQMAEADTVPVRIVNLNDAQALEAQLVENLIRANVHPMEEAQGFKALLDLEDPSDVGTVHKVCANPTCPVHHPKQETSRDDVKWKAEQEKQRKEQAIANTTGIRVLKAIGDTVPVRLMKRDLLFVLMQTFPLLNGWQLQTLARQHGVRKDRETDMLDKLFAAFLRRADEGTLSRLLVEVSVLLASGRSNGSSALRDAAMTYKVDTDLIGLKVKQEFAAKEKAKKSVKPEPNPVAKAKKAA